MSNRMGADSFVFHRWRPLFCLQSMTFYQGVNAESGDCSATTIEKNMFGGWALARQAEIHLQDGKATEAIGLLRKVCALMVRLGRAGEFASYLESVRLAHKPKRNFMKLLAGEKWR